MRVEKRIIESAIDVYVADTGFAPTIADLVPYYLGEIPVDDVLESDENGANAQPLAAATGRCI